MIVCERPGSGPPERKWKWPGSRSSTAGMANLRSVQKAFERSGGGQITMTRTRCQGRRVVLPGVGAFRDGHRPSEGKPGSPNRSGAHRPRPPVPRHLPRVANALRSVLRGRHARRTRPAGRGSRSVPARAGLKVPHMGWNDLRFPRRLPSVQGHPGAGRRCTSSTRTTPGRRTARLNQPTPEADYPEPFTAAVLAGQPVRDPVPPGEEPGGRAERCLRELRRDRLTGPLTRSVAAGGTGPRPGPAP